MAIGNVASNETQTGSEIAKINKSVTPVDQDNDIMDLSIDNSLNTTTTKLDDPEYVLKVNSRVEEIMDSEETRKSMMDAMADGKTFEEFRTQSLSDLKLAELYQALDFGQETDEQQRANAIKTELSLLEIQMTNYGQNKLAFDLYQKAKTESDPVKKKNLMRRAYLMDNNMNSKLNPGEASYYKADENGYRYKNGYYDKMQDKTDMRNNDIDRSKTEISDEINDLESMKQVKKEEVAQSISEVVYDIIQNPKNYLNILQQQNAQNLASLFVGGNNFGNKSNLLNGGANINYIDNEGEAHSVKFRVFLEMFVNAFRTKDKTSLTNDGIRDIVIQMIGGVDGDLKGNTADSNSFFVNRIYLQDCGCGGVSLFENPYDGDSHPEAMQDLYNEESIYEMEEKERNMFAFSKIRKGKKFDLKDIPITLQDNMNLFNFKRLLKKYGKKNMGELMEKITLAYNQKEGKSGATPNEDPNKIDFWKENLNDTTKKNKIAKKALAFYQSYKQYRDGQGSISDSPYFSALIGTMEDYGKTNGWDYNLKDFYKENNDFANDVETDFNIDIKDKSEQLHKIKKLYKASGKPPSGKEVRLTGKIIRLHNNKGVEKFNLNSVLEAYNQGDPKGLNKKEEKVFEILKEGYTEDSMLFDMVCGLSHGYTLDQIYKQTVLQKSAELKNDNDNAYNAMAMISDLNIDGKLTQSDSGIKSGLEMMKVFKSSSVDLLKQDPNINNIEDAQEKVICNIMEYIRFINEDDEQIKNALDTALNGTTDRGEALVEAFKNDPWLVGVFTSIMNNPAVPIQYVMRYGKSTDRDGKLKANRTWQQEMNNSLLLSSGLNAEQMKQIQSEIDEKIKVFKKDSEFQKFPKNKQQDILENLRRAILDKVVIDNMSGGGLGTSIQLIKGLSLNIGLNLMPNGEETFGVSIGLGHHQELGAGFYAGAGIGVSSSSFFVPIANAYIGRRFKLDETKKLNLTAGGFHVIGSPVFGWSLNAGLEIDKTEKLQKEFKKLNFGKIVKGVDINDQVGGIEKISKKLESKFDTAKLKPETIKAMAYKLFIAYKQRNKVIGGDNVEDVFMGQSFDEFIKSQALKNYQQGLVKKKHIGSFGLTISFLEGFFPIPSASIGFVRYSQYNKYSEKNINEIYQSQYLGYGNREVQNINNGEDIVNYINQHLSTLQSQGNSTQLDTNRHNDYELEFNNNDDTITIPQGLIDDGIMTMYIDDSMQGYISLDGNGNIKIPADALCRVYNNANNTGTSFIMNVGSTYTNNKPYTEGGDLQLIKGKSKPGDPGCYILPWLGNPENYEPLGKANKQTVEQAINDLKTTLKYNGVSSVFDDCNIDETGNNFIFNNLGSISIDPSSTAFIKSQNGTVLTPKVGTFMIKKKADQTLQAKFDPTYPHSKFAVKYEIEGKQYNNTINLSGSLFGNNTIDNWYTNSSNLFGGKDNILKNIDISQKKKNEFARFIGHTKIGSSDLDAQAQSALDLIKGNTDLSDIYNKIKNLKDNPNKTNEHKQQLSYLLMRLKVQIVVNSSYENSKVSSLIQRRTGPFESIKEFKDMDNILKNEIKEFREEFKKDEKKLKSSYNFGKKRSNIIGYTAFYGRDRRAQDLEPDGFSLTPPGDTRVLCGTKEFDNQEKGKEWFCNEKLGSNEIEKQMLVDAIIGQPNFPASYADMVKVENVIDLIKNGEIKSGNKTLKLKSKIVFYLLGECANESIGLEIEEVKIDSDGSVYSAIADNHTGASLYVNTQESKMEDSKHLKENDGNIAAGWAVKKQNDTPPPNDTDQETDSPPSNDTDQETDSPPPNGTDQEVENN